MRIMTASLLTRLIIIFSLIFSPYASPQGIGSYWGELAERGDESRRRNKGPSPDEQREYLEVYQSYLLARLRLAQTYLRLTLYCLGEEGSLQSEGLKQLAHSSQEGLCEQVYENAQNSLKAYSDTRIFRALSSPSRALNPEAMIRPRLTSLEPLEIVVNETYSDPFRFNSEPSHSFNRFQKRRPIKLNKVPSVPEPLPLTGIEIERALNLYQEDGKCLLEQFKKVLEGYQFNDQTDDNSGCLTSLEPGGTHWLQEYRSEAKKSRHHHDAVVNQIEVRARHFIYHGRRELQKKYQEKYEESLEAYPEHAFLEISNPRAYERFLNGRASQTDYEQLYFDYREGLKIMLDIGQSAVESIKTADKDLKELIWLIMMTPAFEDFKSLEGEHPIEEFLLKRFEKQYMNMYLRDMAFYFIFAAGCYGFVVPRFRILTSSRAARMAGCGFSTGILSVIPFYILADSRYSQAFNQFFSSPGGEFDCEATVRAVTEVDHDDLLLWCKVGYQLRGLIHPEKTLMRGSQSVSFLEEKDLDYLFEYVFVFVATGVPETVRTIRQSSRFQRLLSRGKN